jgi:hypothetical protein
MVLCLCLLNVLEIILLYDPCLITKLSLEQSSRTNLDDEGASAIGDIGLHICQGV